MDSTSFSLLRRLHSPECEIAWERFVELYAPLIFHWGRGRGLNATDAAELVQDVLTILVTKLPEFRYDPNRRFRGWLRTIAVNRATDLHRRNTARPAGGLDESIHPVSISSDVDLFAEREYRGYLVRRALQLMKADFREETWQACWQTVVEERPVAEVAAELNLSHNAVRVAKCRVLRRLREELSGLWD